MIQDREDTAPGFTGRVVCQHVDRRDWQLVRDLSYRGLDGRTRTARGINGTQPGMLTDFGSRPRLVAAIVPDTDTATEAYVLHDHAYRVDIPLGRDTYRDADWRLLEALRLSGTPIVQRWLTWTGVRWAGLTVRGSAGRRGWSWADTFALAFFTVVALPLVVLPAWCAVPLLALFEAIAAGLAVALRAVGVLPSDRYIHSPKVTAKV